MLVNIEMNSRLEAVNKRLALFTFIYLYGLAFHKGEGDKVGAKQRKSNLFNLVFINSYTFPIHFTSEKIYSKNEKYI